MAEKIRLDALLTQLGKVPSRERARAVIMAGLVFLDGKRLDKPGTMLPKAAVPELRVSPMPYVSRGGLKLEKALDAFGVDPSGRYCIDCGASTGGFTDCLLQRGAKKVYAVDVGYGQLDFRLRQDERVSVLERTNVRYLKPEELDTPPSLAVIDLSFISLRLVLPTVYTLLEETGQAICLIKPQFEAGRELVGKKGVVREASTHIKVLERFLWDAEEAGFGVLALDYSPVKGPEGNIEYLAHLDKMSRRAEHVDVQALARKSHESLNKREGLWSHGELL